MLASRTSLSSLFTPSGDSDSIGLRVQCCIVLVKLSHSRAREARAKRERQPREVPGAPMLEVFIEKLAGASDALPGGDTELLQLYQEIIALGFEAAKEGSAAVWDRHKDALLPVVVKGEYSCRGSCFLDCAAPWRFNQGLVMYRSKQRI